MRKATGVSKVLDPEQAEVKKSRSRSTLSPNRFRIIRKNPEKGRAAPAGEKTRIWNCKASDFQKRNQVPFCFVRRCNFECI